MKKSVELRERLEELRGELANEILLDAANSFWSYVDILRQHGSEDLTLGFGKDRYHGRRIFIQEDGIQHEVTVVIGEDSERYSFNAATGEVKPLGDYWTGMIFLEAFFSPTKDSTLDATRAIRKQSAPFGVLCDPDGK